MSQIYLPGSTGGYELKTIPSSNNSQLTIVAGDSCTGKGTVVEYAVEIFSRLGLPTSIIPTGQFFRAISWMIHQIGQSESLRQITQGTSDAAEYVLPILNPQNWHVDEKGIVRLSYAENEITLSDPSLMQNQISSLIPWYSSIIPVRQALFENGVIGSLISRELAVGNSPIVDTRFAANEMPHETLTIMYQQGRLSIFEVKANNDALERLAAHRARKAYGRPDVTPEEVGVTFQGILRRTNEDRSNGVFFQEHYVQTNFPNAYRVIQNEANGLESLQGDVLRAAWTTFLPALVQSSKTQIAA
jgi:hypothetical protein